MLPKIVIGVILLVIGVMAFGLVSRGGFGPPPISFQEIDENNLPKFVTADFIDLDRVERISKFRSGQGHDFSQGTGETCRSMKHYFFPLNHEGFDPNNYIPKEPYVNIYSPVDGVVSDIKEEQIKLGVQIYLEPNNYSGYFVRLFHIYPREGLKKGDKLSAGEKLGYIGANQGTDVAVDVRSIKGHKFVSYFEVMNDEVFQKYKEKGASSRDDFIITKEYRDSDPLKCNGEQFAENNYNNLSDFVLLNP
ncbi:hypothetical protein A3J13_02735 [Candidatus Daviesbacteria bacterium RIFCSPLOWO2_02_FULL_36_8]|uniref:Uncharacterized protein n=1 Tax=Candidatus Daviesbacteria bacterium RIFCSPLOWO2_02_FULL_36_8 TaxID=1797793 RepID=A0A1F5MFV0_9BACT|nr:MAG: hypothetical protein A3J13_02735 [Candidatus Daviesbacteria bacterium RIFCSPLOWO2_02_FULL_36_8]